MFDRYFSEIHISAWWYIWYIVVRAPALQSEDQSSMLWLIHTNEYKKGIYTFPNWRSAQKGQCGEKNGKFACRGLGSST